MKYVIFASLICYLLTTGCNQKQNTPVRCKRCKYVIPEENKEKAAELYISVYKESLTNRTLNPSDEAQRATLLVYGVEQK